MILALSVERNSLTSLKIQLWHTLRSRSSSIISCNSSILVRAGVRHGSHRRAVGMRHALSDRNEKKLDGTAASKAGDPNRCEATLGCVERESNCPAVPVPLLVDWIAIGGRATG